MDAWKNVVKASARYDASSLRSPVGHLQFVYLQMTGDLSRARDVNLLAYLRTGAVCDDFPSTVTL
jgi:hypothetical protein